MNKTQFALRIFLQHYFDIEWLQEEHLKFGSLNDFRNNYKFLNIIELIPIALRHRVVSSVLDFIFSSIWSTSYVDQSFISSQQLSTHYIARAEKAYREGNLIGKTCWEKVARAIHVSREKEILFKQAEVSSYIQAELAEAQGLIPPNEREVKLWSRKLVEWQRHKEGNRNEDEKKWIDQYIKPHINATWANVYFEANYDRKERWIKYCEKMSRQAKLAGDETTSKDWEAVIPLVWEIGEDTQDVQARDRLATLLFVLTIEKLTNRSSKSIRSLCQAIIEQIRMKVLETKYSKNDESLMSEYRYVTRNFIALDKINSQFQSLSKSIERNRRLNSRKLGKQHDGPCINSLLELIQKSVQCLYHYLDKVKVSNFPLSKEIVQQIYKSRSGFKDLLEELRKLAHIVKTFFDSYHEFLHVIQPLVFPPTNSDLVTEGVLRVFQDCISTVDAQLSINLADEDLTTVTIQFQFSTFYEKMQRIRRLIQSMRDLIQVMLAMDKLDLAMRASQCAIKLLQEMIIQSKGLTEKEIGLLNYLNELSELTVYLRSTDSLRLKPS